MAVDAYAYGWQGSGGSTYGGNTPAAAPKYRYKPKRKIYRPRGGPSRGRGPSAIFDPYGVPWGGPPRVPMLRGGARRLAKSGVIPPHWQRPAVAYGERGMQQLVRSLDVGKILAGYGFTQATPGLDWLSPFGLKIGPQFPMGAMKIDPYAWAFNESMKSMGQGKRRWKFRLGRRNWRKKRRRF